MQLLTTTLFVFTAYSIKGDRLSHIPAVSLAIHCYSVVHYTSILECHCNTLTKLNESECICPGISALLYECAVTGPGTTIWSGSALLPYINSVNTFQLRHSRFNINMTSTVCEVAEGEAIACSIGVFNNMYISQLRLTASLELNNKSVECIHDNGDNETLAGSDTIFITTGKQNVLCTEV